MTQFMDNLQDQVLVLSQQERDFLDKYGDWLERLESGHILPTTERQVQFLAVIRGERAPQHPNEHLWLRVQAARKSHRLLEQAKSEKEKLIKKLTSQSRLVEKLYVEIKTHKREIDCQKGLIAKLQHIADKYEPIQTESAPPRTSSFEICHQCGGDGGAGGRCPRCGGNGFEP
jgi:uncharacterized protein YifE (UPF0438 family)